MDEIIALFCLVGWMPILAICFGVAAIVRAFKD